jgi:predicted nucleic acid-binding protein
VIDASVAIKWSVPEEDQAPAMKLLALAGSGEMEFHIPDLMYCEVGKILWKKVRIGEISEPEAAEIAAALLAASKTVHPSALLLPVALKTACLLGRPVYDCIYLALAEFLGSTLITAVKKLFNALATTEWRHTVVLIQSL